MLLEVLKIFGNHTGIVLFSLNYAPRVQIIIRLVLSEIKAERRVNISVRRGGRHL